MSKIIMTEDRIEAAALGGCLLGGGGGGSMKDGKKIARAALKLGEVSLVDIDDLDPDLIVLTCSGVGAPSSKEAFVSEQDHLRAVRLLQSVASLGIDAFIPNECGGAAIFNGWVPSAALNLPLADAPCNGRAYPTGVMGAMGLHRIEDYVSIQSAVGGNPDTRKHIEAVFQGRIEVIFSLVRQCAVHAGGMVAVAKNPVKAAFVKTNGAPGAVKLAMRVGEAMIEASSKGAKAVAEAAMDVLGGEVVTCSKVQRREIVCEGGFDHGKVLLDDGYEITFWNEYMTLEHRNKRIYTFPDLIMTIDATEGIPVTSAEISEGQNVIAIGVPASNLILGEGMKCRELLEPVEKIIGKSILNYFKN